jgi:ketosteroid isomerase-like protein
MMVMKGTTMNDPRTLIDRYTAAVEAVDKQALLKLYSSEARLFDAFMQWECRGTGAWSAQLEDWFSHMSTHGSSAKATDVEIQATDDMAMLTMFMHYSDQREDGENEGMSNRLTWVAVPNGDDWTILHEHTSVPLNDDMKPILEP